MKDVSATLRRIDEQIGRNTQLMNRLRVENARLEETRLVLSGLAEEDAAAAQMSKAERRQGVINGSHARPMLIVRKVGTGDEEGTASRAAKEGLNASGNRRGMNNPPKRKRNPNLGSVMGQMRDKIAKVLADAEEPMSGSELGNYLGLPAGDKARKPLQNALYSMRVAGTLHRDPEHRYSLPKLSAPQ